MVVVLLMVVVLGVVDGLTVVVVVLGGTVFGVELGLTVVELLGFFLTLIVLLLTGSVYQ